MKYYAYGSNMSEKRMIDRGVKPNGKQVAFLDNYKFIINKRSYKNPDMGFANVVLENNGIVEGILYDINDDDILKLDRFEGAPKHYKRYEMNLRLLDNSIIKGLVYVANPKWVSLGELKATEEYKNHILEGKKFVSEQYYNMVLEKIKI